MKINNASPEERALGLFTRLRQLNFDHCPDLSGIISPSQMTLLDKISEHPGCGVQDIADHLDVSSPTVSVGVSKLEESGLVEREPNPKDARAVQFFLTAHGKNLHNRFQKSRLQKLRRLFAGLNSQEQEALLKLLDRALNNAELDE